MPTPLTTILWKELRENWKWAALGTLCLTLAELYALYQPPGYNTIALSSQIFTLVSLSGSVLIGAALGTLQIVPELDRDRWAALLHRPVPRSTLLFGKIIAGLILYLLATGIPLLLCVACLVVPGQFPAPFIPGMVPPAIANAFMGVAFYAVAVLFSLSRGRWYGRRTLFVLAVLPLLFLIPVGPWLFLPTLIAAALLLIVARATIAGNGSIRPGLRIAEFSAGLLLFVGIEITFGFLLALLSFLPGASSHGTPGAVNRQLVVMSDGKVFLDVYNIDADSHALQELDGTPVTDEKYVGNDATVSSAYFQSLCWNLRSARDLTVANDAGDPHALRNFVDITYGSNNQGTEFWYYLVGKDYFVGYDKLTRRRIGICDRDGFHAANSVPHPFPKPLQIPLQNYFFPTLVWIDGQLYGLDFPDRSLQHLFTAPSGRIRAAAEIRNGRELIYFAIALEKAIQILDPQGKPVVTIPYRPEMATVRDISLTAIPAGERIFVKYEPSTKTAAAADKTPVSVLVDEVDLHGNVLHSYSAPTDHYYTESGWMEYVAYAATPFLPTAIAALQAIRSSNEDNPMSTSRLGSTEAGSWRTILLVGAGLGLLSAVVAFRWARRASLGRNETLGWLVFTFCFGLPGLIAFRLTAPFPTRVSCPSCSRKRPLQTEQCPSCHQAWPAPASSGTEIFAESGC